ncbi:MAG: hypothetical protein AAFO84_13995 [Cyanobacteria bacterium J06598_1]
MQTSRKRDNIVTMISVRSGRELRIREVDFPRICAIKERAEKDLGSGSTWKLFAGAASFLLLIEPVGALVAGTIGGLFVLSLIKDSVTKGAESEYIQRTNNFAHRLGESELIRLIKMVGVEGVIDSCLEARDDGQRLSVVAQKLLLSADEKEQQHSLDDLLAAGLLEDAKAAETSLTGPLTRLGNNAVEVDAVPVSDTALSGPLSQYLSDRLPPGHTQRSHTQRSHTREGEQQSNEQVILRHMAQPKSSVIIAVGGGGKGMYLANQTRERAAADPRYIAFWIDPKGVEDEAGYFAHPQIAAYRFCAAECSPAEISTHLKNAMQHYRALCDSLPPKTPVQLIVDEWYYIQAQLTDGDEDAKTALQDILTSLRAMVSLLDGEHKHITLISQSPKVNDILRGGGGILTNLEKVVLLSNDGRGIDVLNKCAQCGVIPRSLNSPEALQAIAEQSPVNRAIYLSGQLRPMPVLKNYSAYDRDNQRVLVTDHIRVINLADVSLPDGTEPTVNSINELADQVEPATAASSVATAEVGEETIAGKPLAALVMRVLRALDSSDDFQKRLSGLRSKYAAVLLRPFNKEERDALRPHCYRLARAVAEASEGRITLTTVDGEPKANGGNVLVIYRPNGFG